MIFPSSCGTSVSSTHPLEEIYCDAAAAAKSLQSCLTLQPHRRQPTRLLRCPWDSSSKNTGVGCCFLLQCMKVKSESEVARSCPTLSNPMDCSLPAPPSMGFSRQEYWSGVPLPKFRLNAVKCTEDLLTHKAFTLLYLLFFFLFCSVCPAF